MQEVLRCDSANRSGCDDADLSASSSPWIERVRHGSVGRCVHEFSIICQPSLSSRFFCANLGGTEGAERAGQ